jgi:sugar lactone lactonase YvrE
MRRMFAMALVVGLMGSGASAGAHSGGTVRGFENPESAARDNDTGGFFVSNIGPGPINPLGREPDGYLSKISAAGFLETARWVTGLRSPKGIHRRGSDLLVADVGQLVVIDVAGARIKEAIDLDALGAQFPNDVTVDDSSGDAYISDTSRNAIYRLPAGASKAEVWLESDKLDAPNGLFLDGGTLMVASYGQDPDGDGPAARAPGRLLAVDLATKVVRPLGDMAPLGNLDGLEKLGSDWIVTGSDRIWRVTPDGRTNELGQVPHAADLGLRPGDRLAAIPTLSDNTVELVSL